MLDENRESRGHKFYLHPCQPGLGHQSSSALLDVSTGGQLSSGRHLPCLDSSGIQPLSMQVSPSTELLAYAVDTGGGEKYDIQVRDIATGKDLLQKPIPVSWPGGAPLHAQLLHMPLLARPATSYAGGV